MKIYSWNMLFRNQEHEAALEFIRTSEFDVFCLQEVSEAFLKKLKTLPFHLEYATDVDRLTPRFERIYLAILSRHPLINKREIPFPEYWTGLPWRTRLFVLLMRPFHFSKIRNRSCFSVDVSLHGTSIHVFNLHLILAHPEWRLQEFELAMAERDRSRPGIVCGDFNILESPRVSVLNWMLGGRIGDSFFWSRERTHIESRFVSHELANPLRGKNTHPLSRSQLDHILVSRHLQVTNAEVIPERFGSDHHPVFTEVAYTSTPLGA